MVGSSIVFIPGVMIYEMIKAWKVTKTHQSQVKPFILSFTTKVLLFFLSLKISDDMPHYLRALTYASKPQNDWGPARKTDRYGRYDIMNQKPKDETMSRISSNTLNHASDSEATICSRF